MKTDVVILLGLFLISGCAVRHRVPPTYVKNCKVEFEHEVSKKEYKAAIYAVKKHINTWERDFKRRTLPVRIKITHYLRIILGNKRVRGVYYHPIGKNKDLIYVIAGRWNHVPALYHELCHLNIKPGDRHHQDDRWDDWNARASDLNWKLRSDWFDRD
jgi:hypothetical protein